MRDLTYFKIEVIDHIALIRINKPGESVNTLDGTFLDEIESTMKAVKYDGNIQGVIFISSKADCFIAGADIRLLQETYSIEMGQDIARLGQRAFQMLEDSKKPVLTAVHGSCLGGGLEFALASHYILVTDHPKTVIGCPEVLLGLIPAAGGTQRIPQRVSIQKSLDLLLTGKSVRARQALTMGLIDQVVSVQELETAALLAMKRMIQKNLRRVSKKLSVMDRILEGNPLGRMILFSQVKRAVARKTRGLYPAPFSIIRAVEAGVSRGLVQGYRAEVKEFGRLTQSSQSKNLITLFFAQSQLKKNPFKKPSQPDLKLGVIGAGQMGAGIALVSLLRQKEVYLKDVKDESLESGKKVILDELDRRVTKKIMSSADFDFCAKKIHTQKDLQDFDKLDFVIEAVFEDIQLKHRVIAEVEQRVSENCVIATNTSALPISEVAAGAIRPQNIVGMHYFSPVSKMPLLEIIRHAGNSDEIVSRAVQMGLDQQKTVIVVKDSPGFYTTRVLAALLDEAVLILQEGVSFSKVDSVMKNFGFPVGPVTLLDEVGIDTASHISDFFLERIGKSLRAVEAPVLREMVQAGFCGRKSKRGFYLYEKKAKHKKGNPAAIQILKKYPLQSSVAQTDEMIQNRLAFRFTLEAVRCLNEGVLSSPLDGDMGAVLGLGFPPTLGGPFRWRDSMGVDVFRGRLKKLEIDFGPRFAILKS